MTSGKASPQSLLQGLKKTKSGRTTNSRYAAEEVGGGGGGDAGRERGGGGRPPRSDRGGRGGGGGGGGRGRGRGTVLLSEIPSASGDVASQSAFSESRDEEMESRGLDMAS